MSRIYSSKFVRLLKTFDPEDMKAFDVWLRSPWNNTNKNLIRLLASLGKYHPDFNDPRLTKPQLFQQVLPKGKFSDRRMNNLLSEGFLAARQYLVARQIGEDESLSRKLLAKSFLSRNLDHWFFKSEEEEIARLEAKDRKKWEDHLALFQLYRTLYHHPARAGAMRPGESPILAMDEQLDLIYVLEKAAVINERISRSKVMKEEPYDGQDAIRRWEMIADGVVHPSVDLYRLRFRYMEENQFEQYEKLRELVIRDLHLLNEREQKIHLISLINDSIRLVKATRLDITDLLPLYRVGLETKALMNNGTLSQATFSAVVTTSNTKGDFAYTHHLIDTYADKLEEQIREDGFHWAKAHTAYWQKDLPAALDILIEYQFTNFFFQLIGRVLTTQTYFDLYLKDDSYEILLFNYLDTFEKWLNREKVWSQSNKISFLRFVQICRMLARHYAAIEFKPNKVLHLLDRETNIQALNWLAQKQGEILDKRR